MFQHIDAYAGDPILSLMETFKTDPRGDKVNLSIGLYYDAKGAIPQLDAVQKAYGRIEGRRVVPSVYLPMEGMKPYREAIQALLFGAGSTEVKAGRVATIQTLGGSGALKVGSDFLKRYFPKSEVWVSDPTWDTMLRFSRVPASRCTPILTSTRRRWAWLSMPCWIRSPPCRRKASCCCTRVVTIRPART